MTRRGPNRILGSASEGPETTDDRVKELEQAVVWPSTGSARVPATWLLCVPVSWGWAARTAPELDGPVEASSEVADAQLERLQDREQVAQATLSSPRSMRP